MNNQNKISAEIYKNETLNKLLFVSIKLSSEITIYYFRSESDPTMAMNFPINLIKYSPKNYHFSETPIDMLNDKYFRGHFEIYHIVNSISQLIYWLKLAESIVVLVTKGELPLKSPLELIFKSGEMLILEKNCFNNFQFSESVGEFEAYLLMKIKKPIIKIKKKN